MRRTVVLLLPLILAACGNMALPVASTVASAAMQSGGSDSKDSGVSADRSMKMAERALAEGKPEMAAVFYRSAALAEPQNPAPRRASAALFERTGDVAAAAGIYEQVAREQKSQADYLAAGRNYLKASQPDKAITVYEVVLANDARVVAAHNGLAVAYDLQQNHTAAARHYALAYDEADSKNRSTILLNWSLSLMLAGEAGQAVQKLEPVVKETESPALRQALALAYGLSGRVDEARAMGLNTPPTLDQLRQTVRDYGMGADLRATSPKAAPVQDVVTIPTRR
jgi:tetratricopeptide (TPR) repeat protein